LTGPTVRVTRIRSDIAQAAMTADLVLQASADQSELSNIRDVTQSVNEVCPIYNGCSVVGSGTLAQAQASVDAGASSSSSSSVAGVTSGAACPPLCPAGGASNGSTASAGAGGNGNSAAGGAASGANSGNANGGGCIASPPGTRGTTLGFIALAGMIGLFVGRSARMRRRSARRSEPPTTR
jgi:hypothetical protein